MKYNTQEVAGLEPDYLGFIFWEPSARYFNQTLPEVSDHIKKVGVFVDAPLEQLILQVYEHDLDLIQLHGDELCLRGQHEPRHRFRHQYRRQSRPRELRHFLQR